MVKALTFITALSIALLAIGSPLPSDEGSSLVTTPTTSVTPTPAAKGKDSVYLALHRQ